MKKSFFHQKPSEKVFKNPEMLDEWLLQNMQEDHTEILVDNGYQGEIETIQGVYLKNF